MKRLAGGLVLLFVLTAGCREDGAPADQQINDIESTVAAIESEMAGD